MTKLDRHGRKPDLRVAFPDLTENEALALRAMHEGDASYCKHMSLHEIAAACVALNEKGYGSQLKQDSATGEWER